MVYRNSEKALGIVPQLYLLLDFSLTGFLPLALKHRRWGWPSRIFYTSTSLSPHYGPYWEGKSKSAEGPNIFLSSFSWSYSGERLVKDGERIARHCPKFCSRWSWSFWKGIFNRSWKFDKTGKTFLKEASRSLSFSRSYFFLLPGGRDFPLGCLLIFSFQFSLWYFILKPWSRKSWRIFNWALEKSSLIGTQARSPSRAMRDE